MVRFARSLAAGCAACALAVGCADAEKVFDVSGTVTHDGKPIAKGLIFFDPDAGKGGKGSQGFANIENGKFDTAAQGKGVRGGPYTIRINGFDGKVGPEAPFGAALFPEHQFNKELPAEKQTLDYDVKKAPK
jgi:hypothetical protein